MVQFVLMNIIVQRHNQPTKDLMNYEVFDHQEVIQEVLVKNMKAKLKVTD